jgi:hypothetical protein
LIVGTLHVLAVNSVQSLFNYYTEQLENTPSLADIQATNKIPEKRNPDDDGPPIGVAPIEAPPPKETSTVKKEPTMPVAGAQLEEEKEEEKILPSLYITEFVLDLESLNFRPDLDQFREIVGEIMQRFKETLLKVDNLVPDKYFDAFTRPIINRKFEEKVCGEGPKLELMFDEDLNLKSLESKCRECLNAAFNAAQSYAETFHPYRQFYRENENTDIEKMRTEKHEVEFFAYSLEKYHREEEMAKLIVNKRPLGMLLGNFINL